LRGVRNRTWFWFSSCVVTIADWPVTATVEFRERVFRFGIAVAKVFTKKDLQCL
jgi:hypothetical protein